MENQVVISIVITTLIWLVVLVLIIMKYKNENEKNRLKFISKINENEKIHQKKINKILDESREEKKLEYDKGFSSAQNKSDFKIQVEPYKRIAGNKGIFSKKQVLEIGYIYRLFVKGVPSLEPHIQIVQRIKKSEVNEQNIKLALEKLNDFIGKVPSPHLNMVGNVKEFGGNILTSLKKKKN